VKTKHTVRIARFGVLIIYSGLDGISDALNIAGWRTEADSIQCIEMLSARPALLLDYEAFLTRIPGEGQGPCHGVSREKPRGKVPSI
jgi:hypothetical protein